MNNETFLKFAEQAVGVYGLSRGTPALITAQYGVVPVERFQATSPDFTAALYKDPATGRYRIAVAGTDDLRGTWWRMCIWRTRMSPGRPAVSSPNGTRR
jgi:hypothetical protein